MERLELWAKSDGTSIREHTDKLHENLNLLKKLFGDLIGKALGDYENMFWEALRLACECHDYGKMHGWFQKKVGNPAFRNYRSDIPEVRHNLLSPAFLPPELEEPYRTLVALAIVHHHDYEPSEEERERVERVLSKEFGKEMSFTHKKVLKLHEREVLKKLKGGEGLKKTYYMLKGFLLRLDHASSSRVARVEVGRLENPEEKVEAYLKDSMGSELNDLQRFVLQNREDNLLITASTGYGKTEAGFIFLKDKGFFTIPVRTSANAIYERAKSIFGEEWVGLLHSTSPLYLIENSEESRNFSIDSVVRDIFLTRNYGKPLTVSTPDQLFPFILRPRGFEKYYSLFSYARVVLDEVQLFEPHTLGFIVKAIEKINSLGGKVMVMTATLPSYVRKDLEAIDFKEGSFYTESPRHNLKLFRTSLFEDEGVNLIKRLSERGKVLVITNTREKAVLLKNRLGGGELLHSLFIHRDRKEKEKRIEEFFKGSEGGVWITTQIAEVSLDLDADFLVTELSTADSLIQRMGRVNRRGEKGVEEPNVFVFIESCSGIGSVYRKSIHEATKELLREGVLGEEEKLNLIERVYEKVARIDRDYMERYKRAKDYIDSLWSLEEQFSKEKAQRMFRDIMALTVIPKVFREEVESLIRDYREEKDYVEKLRKFSELTGYMFSVPHYSRVSLEEKVEGLREVFWVKGRYSRELGFEPEGWNDDNII